MFELMHQPMQARKTPYRDHAQRNGDGDHNCAAENVRDLHLAIVGEREREVGMEKQAGGQRTGSGGHQRREEFVPERDVIVTAQRLGEDQRSGDGGAEQCADGACRGQDRPVQRVDAR